MFSKSLDAALAAMALLAETYDGGQTVLTVDQIAADRALSRPYLAKLLTALVQGGLVTSKPGRGGGFTLALAPGRISLLDVARCVGYRTRIHCCAFGPGYDGDAAPCPLHHRLGKMREQIDSFLTKNTLAAFARR